MNKTIETAASELGSTVRERLERGQEYARSGMDYINDQTRRHPFCIICTAFIVGLLIGKANSR